MTVPETETRMLTGSPPGEFVRFVFPSVFGLLAISSASVIDGIFIGNFVGATALAAVSLTMPLIAFVFGLLIMISLGGTVVAGKHLGEGDTDEASNIFSKTGLVLVLMMLALAMLTLLVPEAISKALGARGPTVAMSSEYIWVTAWFFPAFGIALFFNQFARVDGRPDLALDGMIGLTLTNIALDYVMVARLEWGLFGAALATGLAYVFNAAILLFYYLGPRAKLRMIRPHGSWLIIFRTAFNGFSEFLNETSSGLVLLLFNWILMTQVGALGVAAFTVVDYVIYFGILIFYGVAEGVVPLVSVNLGGQKPARILRFLFLGIGFSILVGATLIALLLTWPDELIGFFLADDEPEIRDLAVSIIAIVWPMFAFGGINIAISAYFTGMHCAKESALIAGMRSLILPISLVLLLGYFYGFMGAFYALPISEALTFVLSLILLRSRLPNQIICVANEPAD